MVQSSDGFKPGDTGIFESPGAVRKKPHSRIISFAVEHFSRTGGLNRRKIDSGAKQPRAKCGVPAVDYAFPIEVDRVVITAMDSDRRKFVALLESHGPALLGMLRRLCRNAHDADDVYQDTAMRVWRHFPQRPRLRNPKSWLMTIAYRAFVDHHERRRKHEPLIEPADQRGEGPEAQAEKAEWSQRIAAALEALSPAIRQVVVLHYSGGLTLRETAAAMDVSIGTVKSRLNSGLEALRSVLE
jgi:RNA polymerase sigma-70 factor (ECF subfamily)